MKCQVRQITLLRKSPWGVVANEMKCNIVVNEFEPKLRYYIFFQTNTHEEDANPLSSPVID